MKTQKGFFIELPDDFHVSVPKYTISNDDHFVMRPSALYITYNHSRAWIQYAGEEAGNSHAVFEIPCDPKHLRKLSNALSKLAKQLEGD